MRCGSLMANVCDLDVWQEEGGGGGGFLAWVRHFTLIVPLSTQEYK